ncbi:unnamed protein product [Echinostoma caproni]|uniref:AAA_9 domain-containing protein n=1 Tax=Echinostoma caproni TaxID=27848 RepID=A0A183AWT9_9TREM|nr:unnamed protein product [Echinostoma caproni]
MSSGGLKKNENLKNLYRTAGCDGRGVTFIFTDSDVKDEGFLEYINNILASGMVTALNHKYFRTHLEDALSQGRPLLIEDIGEELDPSLDEVLEKNFLKSGTGLKVKVGDKEVDLQKGFTLYMTTKLPNPAYPPEVSARASIIDFTVTSQGLEDQLLARVIQTEKEDLEHQRLSLIASTTANRRRILELENSLLYRLANTEGSLVDDQGLVDVLQTTKSTSIEVAQQLTQAQDTEAEITAAREEFRPVAARGSLLYFLITELTGVNPMYHTGLNRFLRLFDKSMSCSEPCPVTSKRVMNIINYMTRSVWAFAVRGMFKMDRTMTTLMLALRIDLQRKNIRQEEFTTFIQMIEMSKQFQSQSQNGNKYLTEAPHQLQLRLMGKSSVSPICPSSKRILQTLSSIVIVGESDCRTPLVGLLSMGADPTPFIEQAARRAKLELNAVSMGQGQEVHARRLVKQAMTEATPVPGAAGTPGAGGAGGAAGGPGGAEVAEGAGAGAGGAAGGPAVGPTSPTATNPESGAGAAVQSGFHERFRLWVTTEEHKSFPINFLQVAIKFTNEPPEGIKANLYRTYSEVTQDFLDTCVQKVLRDLLYALAFLHCTAQERRKFGPMGWSIPYEYNQSDFNASVQFIQNHLDSLEFKKAQKVSVSFSNKLCILHFSGEFCGKFF